MTTMSLHRAYLLQEVIYAGFVNCDNPAREPDEHVIEGIHHIFSTKKLIKQAQMDNPLACRGFKKAVILTISTDGFRLDMATEGNEGSLFSANAHKILSAQAIDRNVYVVVRRGTGKGGKYSCHCLAKGLKKKERAQAIALFINENVCGRSPSSSPTTQRRKSLLDDDESAAQIRIRMGVLEGEAEAPRAGGGASGADDGYIDTELRVVDGGAMVHRKSSGAARLRDYVAAPEDGNDSGLKLDEIKMLRENDDDMTYNLGGVGTSSYESQPWFKGTMERIVAEALLESKPPGTFLVRVSLTKVGFCLTLRTTTGTRHFLTENRDNGRFALQGHKNDFIDLINLIAHYTKYPITAEGDKCVEPCE